MSLRAALVAGLLALVVAVHAPLVGAHALLDHGDPAAGSKLASAPSKITLFFVQGLVPKSSWVMVLDAGGNDAVGDTTFDPTSNKIMNASLGPMGPGLYTVKWQSLSADDDDYATGNYQFTVLNPDGSDPASAGGASSSDKTSSGGGSLSPLVILAGGSLLAVAGIGFIALVQRRRRA